MITSRSTFHYLVSMQVIWFIIVFLTRSEYDHTRMAISLYILQFLIACVYLSQVKVKHMKSSSIICGGCFLCTVLYVTLTKQPIEPYMGFAFVLMMCACIFMIRKQCQYKDMLREYYPWILRRYNMFDFTQGREKERFLEDALKKEMENEGDDRARDIMELRGSIYAIGFLHFETIMFCLGISMILNYIF